MAEDRFGIVGKIIARTYEIRDVVAEGGFGVVYRAYHQGFRAEVALKCLKIPNELTDSQRRAFLEQFRSEAEVLFRLSAQNTNIVRPLHVDAFHTARQKLVPFMALEWLDGRTLDALIIQRTENGRPPLALHQLVRLLTPVAVALEQAHNLPGRNGPEIIVHRDMKPENLFIARVGDRDVAKILDFGISKVKSTAGQMVGRASMNADALVSFSPAYGAPEQWAPRRYGQTGRWTDVWGLALTLVEAAKGDEVVSGDQAAMMGTILDPERRPTPRNEGVRVSDQVEAVFRRALAVDPRDRYGSVGDFWDDLSESLSLRDEVGSVSLRLGAPSAPRITGLDSVAPGPPSQSEPTPATRAATHPASAQPSSRGGYGDGSSGWGAGLDLASRPSAPPGQGSARPSQLSWPTEPSRSLWKELSPALSLVGLSLAFTALDRAFAHSRGIPLSFGPIQASWVAGGLMVIALVTGIAVLHRAMND